MQRSSCTLHAARLMHVPDTLGPGISSDTLGPGISSSPSSTLTYTHLQTRCKEGGGKGRTKRQKVGGAALPLSVHATARRAARAAARGHAKTSERACKVSEKAHKHLARKQLALKLLALIWPQPPRKARQLSTKARHQSTPARHAADCWREMAGDGGRRWYMGKGGEKRQEQDLEKGSGSVTRRVA
jgi:hypothetical protein